MSGEYKGVSLVKEVRYHLSLDYEKRRATCWTDRKDEFSKVGHQHVICTCLTKRNATFDNLVSRKLKKYFLTFQGLRLHEITPATKPKGHHHLLGEFIYPALTFHFDSWPLTASVPLRIVLPRSH